LTHFLLRSFEAFANRYGYKFRGSWLFVGGEIALTKGDKPHLVGGRFRTLNGPWRKVVDPFEAIREVAGIGPGRRHRVGLPCDLRENSPRLWLEFEAEESPEEMDRLSKSVSLWFSYEGRRLERVFVAEAHLVRLAECVCQCWQEPAALIEGVLEESRGHAGFRKFVQALEAYRGGVLV
jgi:hypothetical protein